MISAFFPVAKPRPRLPRRLCFWHCASCPCALLYFPLFPFFFSLPRFFAFPSRLLIASHQPHAARTTYSTSPWTVRRIAHAAICARSTSSITDRSYMTKSRGAYPRRGTRWPAAAPGSRASGLWAHAGPTASSPGHPTASSGPGRRRASRRARPGAGPRPG